MPTPAAINITLLRTKTILRQLDQAIQSRDLDKAVPRYHVLRHRTLAPESMSDLFRCQCRLLELFHRTRLQKMDTSSPDYWKPYLKAQEQHRRQVLRDIVHRTLRNLPQASRMASLVDAIAQSKAIVGHAYGSNSRTKRKDVRRALKVLEDWSASTLFSRTGGSNRSTVPDQERVKATPLGAVASVTMNDFIRRADNEGVAVNVNADSSTTLFNLGDKAVERDLALWLSKLMKILVHSRPFLVRSMLDTIPKQFGMRTTVDMYIVLLDYYSLLKKDRHKNTLDIIHKMTEEGVEWQHEPAIYEYLLYSLSQERSKNSGVESGKIIQKMLDNHLVPRAETMKAAILSAARTGDLQTCSHYIQRMHEEWGLSVTDHMKAVLLYACAKRGDFDSAVEILQQLGASGRLVDSGLKEHVKSQAHGKESASSDQAIPGSLSTSHLISKVEGLLETEDIVNNSNVLLALINQSYTLRGNRKRLSQVYIKEEVSKVLELFTHITKTHPQVDAQLYTIMMQYLSTLPSPVPGMMYLYREMQASSNTRPNRVTYTIMLEACAEQLDLDTAQQLWKDLEVCNISKDSFLFAAYVKAWGRTGHLETAEGLVRQGRTLQQELDQAQLDQPTLRMIRKTKKLKEGGAWISKTVRMPEPQQHVKQVMNVVVLNELMKAYRDHRKPDRVLKLYQEVMNGEWGREIQPNEFSLSIVLGACGSDAATPAQVDQGIELVEQFLQSQKQQQLRRLEGVVDREDPSRDRDLELFNTVQVGDPQSLREDDKSPSWTSLDDAVSRSQLTVALSDANYRLYYVMLGRHHQQRKLMEVWEVMMQSVEQPPSRLTVRLVTEVLEQVQWGAGPIKRIHKQLREQWPDVDWTRSLGQRRGRYRPDSGDQGTDEGEDEDEVEEEEDDGAGAGGRFWR
ncbi:hypothetical protein EDD11_009393 [Mortierella claussenii]|nr:hypothetical protein EDD11_009393 [Mortierella claussenii]